MNEDEKISGLLRGLEKIDAPDDFAFRVKARIANGRPERSGGGMFAFLKYAVPVAALVLFGAFIFVETNLVYDTAAVPPVAANEMVLPGENGGDIAENSGGLQLAVHTSDEIVGANSQNPERSSDIAEKTNTKNAPVRERDDADGGSYDTASSDPRDSIMPPGIPNPLATKTPPVRRDEGSFRIADILSQIGIVAKRSSGGDWSASDVKGGSLAERAGVKKGDVIQAIGETRIKGLAEIRGRFSAKSITVSRGGAVSVLELR
jgi:membrane-associated protease RseP (regulator of RpoE activity)